MIAKVFQPLTTPVGNNEQTAAGQATITATTTFTARGLANGAEKALFFLDVSAASGTSPSLTVVIEGQDPGSEKWLPVASFPAQTGATGGTPIDPIAVDPLYYQQVRVTATVTGTSPSFTFSCGALFIGQSS